MATLEQIEQLLDRKLNEKFENFRKEITDDFKLITDDIKLTIEENKKNIAGKHHHPREPFRTIRRNETATSEDYRRLTTTTYETE